jgi:hypothetical protein
VTRIDNDELIDMLMDVMLTIDTPTTGLPVPIPVQLAHIKAGVIIGEFVNEQSTAFQLLFEKKLIQKYPQMAEHLKA